MMLLKCLILGLSSCLFLTNCLPTSGGSSSNTGQATNGVVVDIKDLDSVSINYFSPLPVAAAIAIAPTNGSLSWNHSTGLITFDDLQSGVTKTCNTPADVLAELDSFWAKAQICVSKYVTPATDIPVICPMIATMAPWLTFKGSSQSYPIGFSALAGPCNQTEYYICNSTDATNIQSIAATLEADLPSLVCK